MGRLLPLFVIAATFVVASMMNVYPLSFALASYRPMMLILVLIFWAMYQPKYVGVGVAFLVGLAADLLLDTHLGHQAFCAVVAVFVIRVMTVYAKRLSFSSAWILTTVALSVYRLFLWLFQSFAHEGFSLTGFLSFVVSLLIFPVLWWVLMRANRRISPRVF